MDSRGRRVGEPVGDRRGRPGGEPVGDRRGRPGGEPISDRRGRREGEPISDRRGRPGGGALISAVCALALAATMFALRWFGTITPPPTGAVRSATTGSEDGWHGLPVVRWVMLAAVASALVAALWRTATRADATASRVASVAVVALGTGAAALLVYRVLIALPSQGQVVDQKLGAYLGLLAAAGIAYGAVDSLAARRGRRLPSRPDC